MKRISIYLMSLMLSGAFFAACEKEDKIELTFDKNSVEAVVGEEAVVKVSGGEAPYTVEPADGEVIEATVEGNNITIKTLKAGNTTVKVSDKNGVEAIITVKVEKDPYEEEKGDATVRIQWDSYKKVSGTDEGTYTLTKTAEKVVAFSWTNEEESLLLSLNDPQDEIGADLKSTGSATSVGKLTVTEKGKEPVDYDVTAWKLVQAQPAEEGASDSYWITFAANGKEGLFVAPLTELE